MYGSRSVGLVAFVAAIVVAAAGCGSSSSSTSSTTATTSSASSATSAWGQPNGDLWNRRHVASSITSSNVDKLGIAWTLPLTAKGAYGTLAANPVVGDGRVYIQDLVSDVTALDLQTGKVAWKRAFNSPVVGPNGVTFVGGKLYGETGNSAFALDAKTGNVLWKKQFVKGPGGLAGASKPSGLGFDIQPLVSNGVVYLSTATMVGGGSLYALDAKTGSKRWSFDTVIDPVADKVPPPGTGGAWNTPALMPDGTVLYGIGNPYQPAATATASPGKRLYTDSTVALNAKTGKLRWYYQGVVNDFYDWDMQISPIYDTGGGRPIVLDAGKMGYIYGIDPKTGKLRWKTPVGKHNGHDKDGVLAMQHELKLKYPETVEPGIYGGVETNMAVADGVVYAGVVDMPSVNKSPKIPLGSTDFAHADGEFVAVDEKSGKILWNTKLPQMPLGDATVSNDLVFTTTFDGYLIALSRKDGHVVLRKKLPAGTNAPVLIQDRTLVTAASFPQGKGQTAQLIAFRIGASGKPSGTSTGKTSTSTSTGGGGKAIFTSDCATCHTLAAAGAGGTVGPNLDELKPSAATVARQVENGGGGMPSFSGRLKPAQIQAVAAYVARVAGTKTGATTTVVGP